MMPMTVVIPPTNSTMNSQIGGGRYSIAVFCQIHTTLRSFRPYPISCSRYEPTTCPFFALFPAVDRAASYAVN